MLINSVCMDCIYAHTVYCMVFVCVFTKLCIAHKCDRINISSAISLQHCVHACTCRLAPYADLGHATDASRHLQQLLSLTQQGLEACSAAQLPAKPFALGLQLRLLCMLADRQLLPGASDASSTNGSHGSSSSSSSSEGAPAMSARPFEAYSLARDAGVSVPVRDMLILSDLVLRDTGLPTQERLERAMG